MTHERKKSSERCERKEEKFPRRASTSGLCDGCITIQPEALDKQINDSEAQNSNDFIFSAELHRQFA